MQSSLVPDLKLRLTRAPHLEWRVLHRRDGVVVLKTPFQVMSVEALPVRVVQQWLREGTMMIVEERHASASVAG